MVRYNTIRNLGPIEPRDRSAEVLNQSFATGMRLAQSAQYMRMQKLKIAEAKQQARNSQLYAITKDIPVGFAHNVIPPGGEEVANNFLRTKRQEYVTLASQLVDNKIDPSSEEFFAINNQMNSIKSAIINYEEQMKKISQNVTVITDANNDSTLPHIPDNKVAEDFYIGGLKNGAMGNHDIDDNGNVLFFEMIEDPENPGELIRVPKMYNGKPMGGDNIPSITIKDDKYLKSRNELFDLDTKYLAEHEKYGKITSQSEAYWDTIMPQLVKKLKPHELRMLVTDGDTEYAELITQAQLDDELDFYDKDGDGEKDINEMSYRDLYNNHEALQEWYIEQKKEVVKNKATSLMDKWKQDNPPVGGELDKLGDPEYQMQNIFNQTSGFNDTMLAPVNAVKKDLLEEYSKTSRTSADYAGYVKKVNDLHKANQTARKTAHYLNSQLGYNKGTSMIYSSDDAYNQYKNSVNAALEAWKEEGKSYPTNRKGEVNPDQTVNGKSYEAYLAEKPEAAFDKNKWAENYIGYGISENSLIFVNPSTQPGIPTSYTPIPELDGWDNMTNNETLTRYIGRRSNIRFNERAVQQHRLFGGGPDDNL